MSLIYEYQWIICLICIFIQSPNIEASVTINLGTGVLSNSSGIVMSDGGLLQLVASTQDTVFSAPTASSFVLNDDQIEASWSLNGATNMGPGSGTDLHSITFSYSGNFGSGDLLQLRWFPTLTTASITPGVNTPYGVFRSDTSGLDQSDIAWIAPSDGSTVTLNFLTTSAGGSHFSDTMGQANLMALAIPEVSQAGLLRLTLELGCIMALVLQRKTKGRFYKAQ
ncbi:MAG: hypothetical protein V4507_15990 [Verrucomicrobiota bacterium]